MSEKIEMEEDKLRSMNSIDNTYLKLLNGNAAAMINGSWYNQGRTNSTVLFKQPNSIEIDRAQLRKTRSAEFMEILTPTIVIGLF